MTWACALTWMRAMTLGCLEDDAQPVEPHLPEQKFHLLKNHLVLIKVSETVRKRAERKTVTLTS